MDFPANLKSWRVAKGFSQAELAARAGMFRPNLVELESGKRDCTLKTLERLASALKISPGRLIDTLPQNTIKLGRHQIDALAKGLMKPEPPLTPDLEQLRELLVPLVFPILRAAGVNDLTNRKKTRSKRSAPLLRAKLNQETIDQIIRRVNKLAASRI